jgi:hypothetical protein
VGVGCEVKDHVMVFEFFFEGGKVEEVCLDEGEVFVVEMMVDEGFIPGAEVVVHGDGIVVVEKGVDEVASDESGSAGDECVHGEGIRVVVYFSFDSMIKRNDDNVVWMEKQRTRDRAYAFS